MQISLATALLSFVAFLLFVGVGVCLLWLFTLLKINVEMAHTVNEMYVFMEQFADTQAGPEMFFHHSGHSIIQNIPQAPNRLENFDDLRRFFDVNESEDDDENDDDSSDVWNRP